MTCMASRWANPAGSGRTWSSRACTSSSSVALISPPRPTRRPRRAQRRRPRLPRRTQGSDLGGFSELEVVGTDQVCVQGPGRAAGTSSRTLSAASACWPRYISSSASAAACPTTWLSSASSCPTGIPLTRCRPCWPRAVASKALSTSGCWPAPDPAPRRLSPQPRATPDPVRKERQEQAPGRHRCGRSGDTGPDVGAPGRGAVAAGATAVTGGAGGGGRAAAGGAGGGTGGAGGARRGVQGGRAVPGQRRAPPRDCRAGCPGPCPAVRR